jgi:hypothetical protein
MTMKHVEIILAFFQVEHWHILAEAKSVVYLYKTAVYRSNFVYHLDKQDKYAYLDTDDKVD